VRERARRNRIKALVIVVFLALTPIEESFKIFESCLFLKRSCSCLTVKKELCVPVRERLWLLNVPSISHNKKKTERFFIKMEISNGDFMVENI